MGGLWFYPDLLLLLEIVSHEEVWTGVNTLRLVIVVSCALKLFYIYCISSLSLSCVVKQPPGRLRHSALELLTNKVWVCPHSCRTETAAVFFNITFCVFILLQCELSVAELMSTYSEPLFYDVFMDLGGEEERKLFPLPTLVHNLQYNGQFVNQGGVSLYECQRGGGCIVFRLHLLSFHRKHEKLVPL